MKEPPDVNALIFRNSNNLSKLIEKTDSPIGESFPSVGDEAPH